MSEQWISEMRSDVFGLRWGRGIGTAMEDKSVEIHFGISELPGAPDMNTEVFFDESRTDWNNCSRGEGVSPAHGLSKSGGKEETVEERSTLIFFPGRILRE
jgi:hypothetical protein